MATQRRVSERRWDALSQFSRTALIGLAALAYLGVVWGWISIASEQALVAAVWAPAGLALAAVVALGYRIWPAIALGAFAAHAAADASVASAIGIAAGYTLAALAGGYLLARAGFDPALRRYRDVTALAALGAALGTLLSASGGVAGEWAAGQLEAGELWLAWRAWWLGDLTGVLVVAPAILVLSQVRGPLPRPVRALAASGLVIAVVAITALAVRLDIALVFAAFALMVLAGIRLRQPGAVLVVPAVATVAILVTAQGEGLLAGGSLDDELLKTQIFTLVAALAVLLAAAWRTELDRATHTLGQLAESASALAEAQRVARVGSWEWDLEADHVRWSLELYRLLGLEPESAEASYETYVGCIHPEDRVQVEAAIARAIEHSEPLQIEHRMIRPDGAVRTFLVNGRVIAGREDEPVTMLGTAQDVTEHRVAEARFRDLLESAPDAMVILDDEGEIMLVNSQTEEMFGYPRAELIGRSVKMLIPESATEVHPNHPTLFPNRPPIRGPVDGDRVAIRKDGTELPVEVNFNPLENAGQVLFVGAIRDVTERKLGEQRLEHMALHDPLTGLPNRNLFLDRLDHALTRSQRPGSNLAVYFCDIDNFKKINDGLGHEVGDELLTALPARLGQALRAADTVARLGGDEFVILCEDLESDAAALAIAERIAQAFRKPFILEGNEHYLTVSVGVIVVHGGRATASEVLRDADVAMYRAKTRGKGNFELFDAEMRARVVARLELEKDLRGALRDDRLRLVYQPVVSLRSGRFVSVEALLRWDDRDRGTLAPPQFIDVAEESGLIVPIGGWVIREACRHAAAWSTSRMNGAPLGVSINLSPRQVADWKMVDLLSAALEETGVDPSLVELEITEQALIENSDAIPVTLKRLKEIGVRLALDDFGTGHSSLSRLKQFPIDALKIDREFIAGLGDRDDDTAIVSAVLSMAWALEVDVVAEGVETTAQLDWLTRHGCRYAQGFLISPPLTVEELGGVDSWDRIAARAQPAR